MMVSQKCQYALRSVFELSLRCGEGPIKIAAIAKAQAIPARFLEVILGQLKQGQFVRSRRGNEGGYELNRPPTEITVGELIRFVEGPFGPVHCVMGESHTNDCPFHGDCVFLPMWEKVEKAISGVYDSTTFNDLVEQHRQRSERYVSKYAI
jgi:Rrf2 family protein